MNQQKHRGVWPIVVAMLLMGFGVGVGCSPKEAVAPEKEVQIPTEESTGPSTDEPPTEKKEVQIPTKESTGPSTDKPPADAKPGDTWTNRVDGSEMVLIPGGEFQMGSPEGQGEDDEHPQHRVRVDSFWLGKYEVTNAQWKKFVDANPEWGVDGEKAAEYGGSGYLSDWDGDTPPARRENYPVVYVSWYAARDYCAWAGLRLPTEAEWEYAAQGGKGYEYGTVSGKLSHAQANYSGTGNRDKWDGLAPVGQFPANPFGIYDLCGNVWEWCSSEYKPYPYRAEGGREEIPTNIDKNVNMPRVARGGSWIYDVANNTRARRRFYNAPASTIDNYGLRCARAPRP
jgi:formylglycine-generating enzyme required for sulfatase activity